MNVENCKRIAMTVPCLSLFDRLIEDLDDPEPDSGHDRKALVIQVMSLCEGGGCGGIEQVEIDVFTAKKILPAIGE